MGLRLRERGSENFGCLWTTRSTQWTWVAVIRLPPRRAAAATCVAHFVFHRLSRDAAVAAVADPTDFVRPCFCCPTFVGQRTLRSHSETVPRMVLASHHLQFRAACLQAGDKSFLCCSDPQVFRDLMAAMEVAPITIPVPNGPPAKLAIVPPRPLWVARCGTAMKPLYEADAKMLRDCLGAQAALPKLFPRYPKFDGESWVEPWVEKDGGVMMLVCRARLRERPAKTVRMDKVEVGDDFKQYRGRKPQRATPRTRRWVVAQWGLTPPTAPPVAVGARRTSGHPRLAQGLTRDGLGADCSAWMSCPLAPVRARRLVRIPLRPCSLRSPARFGRLARRSWRMLFCDVVFRAGIRGTLRRPSHEFRGGALDTYFFAYRAFRPRSVGPSSGCGSMDPPPGAVTSKPAAATSAAARGAGRSINPVVAPLPWLASACCGSRLLKASSHLSCCRRTPPMCGGIARARSLFVLGSVRAQ